MNYACDVDVSRSSFFGGMRRSKSPKSRSISPKSRSKSPKSIEKSTQSRPKSPKHVKHSPQPHTAVISITTHGFIPVARESKMPLESGYMPTFEVPDNMTITKYSEVPPGTCNLLHDDKIAECIEIVSPDLLSDYFKHSKYDTKKYNKSVYTKVAEWVAKFIIAKKEIVSQEHDHSWKLRRVKSDEDMKVRKQFVHTHDSGYLLHQYDESDKMLNKFYTRNNAEAHGPYDWKIMDLTREGSPDLLYEMFTRRNHGDTPNVSLEAIVKHMRFQNPNLLHIIILDFSCSNYVYDDMTDVAHTSVLRRDMIQSKLFGGYAASSSYAHKH